MNPIKVPKPTSFEHTSSSTLIDHAQTGQYLPAFEFKHQRTGSTLSLNQALFLPKTGLIWLTGHSGSGKSTFLHLLMGMHPEFIQGNLTSKNNSDSQHQQQPQPQNPIDIAIATDAMFLSQNPLTQIMHERIGEEFHVGMELKHTPLQSMLHQAERLKTFGFFDQELSPTHSLSHGQIQRLLLASILACEPKIILMDEPCAFLDEAMRTEVYQMLARIKTSTCVILIDHHTEVAAIADECWHIDHTGQIRTLPTQTYLTQTNNELQQLNIHPQIHQRAESAIATGIEPIDLPHQSKLTLHINQLTIGYDTNQPLFTLHAHINSGECAVIHGQNGCGKSTLLNTLAGITNPLSGAIQLTSNGTIVPIKTHMSYVFQHPDSHFFYDTIAQELQQMGVTEASRILSEFDLGQSLNHSPHQLSEGQKRRFTLLMPMLQKKPLVVLDEPTFGQDPVNCERITQYIQTLKQQGYALIVISHDKQLTQTIATQIWHIEHKRCNILTPSQYSQHPTSTQEPQPTPSNPPEKTHQPSHPTRLTTQYYHDTHALAVLIGFFLVMTYPLAWHSVLALACVFAWMAHQQHMTWTSIIKRAGFALVLSWSVWIWNILYIPEHNTQAIHTANQTFIRVSAMTWVALISAQMLNLRDVVNHMLQTRRLNINIAYALQLGLGSIELMRSEVRRIILSARLRGLSWRDKSLLWVPIMVFALRHATRGAMSLRARGLSPQTHTKTQRYDYSSTPQQKQHILQTAFGMCLVVLLSEFVARILNQ